MKIKDINPNDYPNSGLMKFLADNQDKFGDDYEIFQIKHPDEYYTLEYEGKPFHIRVVDDQVEFNNDDVYSILNLKENEPISKEKLTEIIIGYTKLQKFVYATLNKMFPDAGYKF
jgi:hypothetical protein